MHRSSIAGAPTLLSFAFRRLRHPAHRLPAPLTVALQAVAVGHNNLCCRSSSADSASDPVHAAILQAEHDAFAARYDRLRKLQLYRQLLPIRSQEAFKETSAEATRVKARKTRVIKLLESVSITEPVTVAAEQSVMSQLPIIIDGNATAKAVRQQLKQQVEQLKEQHPSLSAPTLAVVLVGSRKDSQTYVNMKTKACNEVGITPQQYDLPEDATQEDIESLVTKLNNDKQVNGILVQLPLPKHIYQDRVIQLISAQKDVDGLTLLSAGQVFSYGLGADLIACTPLGCIALLDAYNIDIKGKHAVVLGRSQLVGKPVASLLLSRDATVTTCHSRTADLPAVLRTADIIVAALGKPRFVQKEWLKPGVVIIDVGINAIDDASDKRGYRLVGDVDYEQCKDVASAITPVPGGVGPMTVAMLLKNTVKAHSIQNNIAPEKKQ